MQMYDSGCAKLETQQVFLTLKAAFQQSANKTKKQQRRGMNVLDSSLCT